MGFGLVLSALRWIEFWDYPLRYSKVRVALILFYDVLLGLVVLRGL